MSLPGYRGRSSDSDEDDVEVEIEILAQDEDELDAEMSDARESVLEDLRELIDDYVQGIESAEETLSELHLDLAEWSLADNPFEAAGMAVVHLAWQQATDSVRDGYSLIILGIERDQPEFFQTGYGMIEEGLYARDDTLNAD